MVQVLLNSLEQIIVIVLFTYVAGFIISLINRAFYRVTGAGKGICLATGIIGTPIHELSHALFCLIFFHKINEIKFFQIDDENGVLGYVKHSYNPRNKYQKLGNFFIGVAPIIVGALVLLLLIWLLLPTAFVKVEQEIAQTMKTTSFDSVSLENFIAIFAMGFNVILALCTTDFGVNTIVFLVLMLCIALHMNLSGADIKGSLTSIPLIAIILLLVNYILYFVSASNYAQYLSVFSIIECYYLAILIMSIVFSLCLLIIGAIIGIFTRR